MKIKDSIDTNEYIYFKTIIWGQVNSLEICFLMAQKVKNTPAKRDTWIRFLGWEDPLEEGMATHSSSLAWRIPIDRGTWWTTVHGVAESQTLLSHYKHILCLSKLFLS